MSTSSTAGAPQGGWGALIEEIVGGRWRNPATGEIARVPYESVVFGETLEGREAELVAGLKLGRSFAVVSDEATSAAMGSRVARALRARFHDIAARGL